MLTEGMHIIDTKSFTKKKMKHSTGIFTRAGIYAYIQKHMVSN